MPKPDDDRSAIAHHEAGHAVASRVLGRPVALVTIVPSGDCEGAMLHKLPAPDAAQTSLDEATRDIADLCARARALMPIGEPRAPAAEFILESIDQGIELLAGPEAERKLKGNAVWARTDLERAQLYATAIAVSPEAGQFYFQLFRREARSIVHRHWHSIMAVAKRLIECQSLTGDEINSIIAEAEATHMLADAKAQRLAWAQTVERAKAFAELQHHQLGERPPAAGRGPVSPPRRLTGRADPRFPFK